MLLASGFYTGIKRIKKFLYLVVSCELTDCKP